MARSLQLWAGWAKRYVQHSSSNLSMLTRSPDTKPRPHSYDNAPNYAVSLSLVLDTLYRLPVIHTPTTSRHPRQKPTEGLPHTAICRGFSGLYARSRCRRRCMALVPLSWRRIRQLEQTHGPRPSQLSIDRSAAVEELCRPYTQMRIRHSGFLAPDGEPTSPVPR